MTQYLQDMVISLRQRVANIKQQHDGGQTRSIISVRLTEMEELLDAIEANEKVRNP